MPHPLDPDWDLIDLRKKHLLAVGWSSGSAKLCTIQFHKDGFFVHFPFHPNDPGLISRCVARPGSSDLDLAEQGGVVSHKVKYSHHGDGTCLFSQDGKVRSSVRTTQGSPLVHRSAHHADHLFSIDVQGLNQFPSVSEAERCSDSIGRGYFDIASEEPSAVHVVARWKRMEQPSAVPTIRNPVIGLLPDGQQRRLLALSPPAGSPLFGSIMTIEVGVRDPLDMSDASPYQLFFTGGFAPGLDDPNAESTLLAMTYPASLADALPSLDFRSD